MVSGLGHPRKCGKVWRVCDDRNGVIIIVEDGGELTENTSVVFADGINGYFGDGIKKRIG